MRKPTTEPNRLVCAQCLRVDRDGDDCGWRADWAGGHDGEQLELGVLCSTCWEIEFGASVDL